MIELSKLEYNRRGNGVDDMLLPLTEIVRGWVVLINQSVWINDRGQFLFKTRGQALNMFRNHCAYAVGRDEWVKGTGVNKWPCHTDSKEALDKWKTKVNFRVIQTAIKVKV